MPRSHPAVGQLGPFIAERRLAAGYKSFREFGAALAPVLKVTPGSARVMASRWERGLRVPEPSQLRAIARVTKTNYEDLAQLRAQIDGRPDPLAELREAIERLTEIVLERLPPADHKARGSAPRRRG
jgi:transcriptional regulator with XRE-family HTH domain